MASWWPSCNGCRSPMCVAGKNTRAMRDWAMSTKVDTSRSRWRATSISGLWPDTLSATRCAPISSCERRNGGGQACGNAVILREQSGRCWRRGRSICQRIGSSGSIKPTTRRNWKRFAGACKRPPLWPAGMAEGNRETFGPRVGLSSHGLPAKGGPKSKHLARVKISNIGPVPLSVPPFDLSATARRRSRPGYATAGPAVSQYSKNSGGIQS